MTDFEKTLQALLEGLPLDEEDAEVAETPEEAPPETVAAEDVAAEDETLPFNIEEPTAPEEEAAAEEAAAEEAALEETLPAEETPRIEEAAGVEETDGTEAFSADPPAEEPAEEPVDAPATLPENDHVLFTCEARTLAAALSEATVAFKRTDRNWVYMAVYKDPQQTYGEAARCFYAENVIAPEPGKGRIVIGAMGEGRNHLFIDLPARSVEREGRFLLGEPGRLAHFASLETAGATIRVEHTRDASGRTAIEVTDSKGGVYPYAIDVFYKTKDIDRFFTAARDRFARPATAFPAAELAAFVGYADGVRSTSDVVGERCGDLVFTAGTAGGQPGTVEFAAQMEKDQHELAFSARAPLPIGHTFRWEVRLETLRTLKELGRAAAVTYAFETKQQSEKGEPLADVLQLDYERAAAHPAEDETGAAATVYVQRQFEVAASGQPAKRWAPRGDQAIFGHDMCRHWATLDVKELSTDLSKIWAFAQNAIVQIERATSSAGEPVALLTTGGQQKSGTTTAALLGPSAVKHYYFHPAVYPAITKLVTGSTLLQVLSFPDPHNYQRELSNAMIFVPLTDADDPKKRVQTPERYLIVTWTV